MNTKALWISGALVVLMGTASVALAHGDKGQRGGGQRGAMMEEMFERTDANGDGKITQEEVDAAAAARFAETDADGDGLLSAEEIQTFAAAQREARENDRRANRTERMIGRLDANDDGLLSLEELSERGPQDMFARMLDRVDTDEDGAISKEEMEEARANMKERGGRGHGRGFWKN